MKQRLPQLLLAFAVSCFQAEAIAADVPCADIRFTPGAKAVYERIDKVCLDLTRWQGETYVRLKAMVVAQTRSGTHLRFDDGERQPGDLYLARFPKDFQVLLNGQVVGLNSLGIRQVVEILVPEMYWDALEPEPDEVKDEPGAPDRR